jgi:hypothetical protein
VTICPFAPADLRGGGVAVDLGELAVHQHGAMRVVSKDIERLTGILHGGRWIPQLRQHRHGDFAVCG